MATILISVGTASPDNYVNGLNRVGATALAQYLPAADTRADGLILAGGGDMDSRWYGQENCGSRDIDPRRDEAELALLDAFAKTGRPVLGICRGHQVVNVWAGGTLIQDLGPRGCVHRAKSVDSVHPILAGGFLCELYGPRFRVNSAHHQALGVVGYQLRSAAYSEDGVVEALIHCKKPIYTVQFHPERMNCPQTADGEVLLRWFVGLCGKK